MTGIIWTIMALICLAAVSLGIRVRPFLQNPGLGVDTWYWFLCAEDVRKRRRLPPVLRYFMLEIEEQWYPPLYAGLLAFVPIRLLERYGGILSQTIDLLSGMLIFVGVLLGSDSVAVAFLSGLSYIIAFFPLSYNTQLQPRGLGNLLLTCGVMGVWFYSENHLLGFWMGVLALSLILLFLHKMTVQMWIVYLLGFGLWKMDWSILLLIPTSVLLAIVVSRGFYLKMIKAHWDIVSYWHKNIQYLGSHQFYESPIYRKEGFVSTAVHKKGLTPGIGKLLNIFNYNVFILVIPILIYHGLIHGQTRLETFLWLWLGLTYFWALLTTFASYFKALGAGVYYVYQSFFPLFLLTALSVRQMPIHLQWWFFILWGVGLFLSGSLWEKYCASITIQKNSSAQGDLRAALDYLKALPKDGVFCIPFTLPDVTAYRTRKRVFWGGHSYGFNAHLQPYFPVMKENVLEILKKKSLSYILFWTKYLDSLDDIGLKVGRDVTFRFGKGEYEVYEVIK